MFTEYEHYNSGIEMAILGACLIERSAFGRTYGLITSPDFYFDNHQILYNILKEMFEEGLPIDIETVADIAIRVKKIKLLGSDNVPYFLTKVCQHVASSGNLEYHCYIMKLLRVEREIITLTSSGAGKLTGNTKERLSLLQKKAFEIGNFSSGEDWQTMEELMVGLYQHQDEMIKNKGMGIPSGLSFIDNTNGGFHPGQMIVIGARPSVGKSAFINQLALDMAKAKTKVGIISLEMNNNEVAARLAAIDTDTDFSTLYRGLYQDENQSLRVQQRINSTTSKLPIYVSDKTNVNIHEIRAKAEKLKAKHGLDVLIIDYLQLIETNGPINKNREYEVAKMSRGCKIMAKQMNVPVIVLCQLNREVLKRKGNDRYPQLSDLRESGSIEQDADVVMFLHRDWMIGIPTFENGASTEFDADLIGRKWRNGASNWHIKLDFEPTKMKFTERNGPVSFTKAPADTALLQKGTEIQTGNFDDGFEEVDDWN